MQAVDTLSVYVHMPWCVQKCPYCDFNSHTLKQVLPEQHYVAALLADLAADMGRFNAAKSLHSIFFGGGTPSLFSGTAVAEIIQAIYRYVPAKNPVEITLEANPGTVDAAHFEAYLLAGINRLSLGVQSFDDDALRQLGRIHHAKAAKDAYQLARALGYTNINIDLMFGLPNQTIAQGLHDLKTAICLEPEHISWYQLTLEPNTPFYRQPPTLPSHDDVYELYEQGRALLTAAGYLPYEVSAYAKSGKQCQHNLNYWRYGDYIGIGAGAHGKITNANPWQVMRTRKHMHPSVYLREKVALHEIKQVKSEEVIFEYLLNHLRLEAPVALSHLMSQTGQALDTFIHQAKHAADEGFMELTQDSLQLTAKGRLFLDDVLTLFLPEPFNDK